MCESCSPFPNHLGGFASACEVSGNEKTVLNPFGGGFMFQQAVFLPSAAVNFRCVTIDFEWQFARNEPDSASAKFALEHFPEVGCEDVTFDEGVAEKGYAVAGRNVGAVRIPPKCLFFVAFHTWVLCLGIEVTKVRAEFFGEVGIVIFQQPGPKVCPFNTQLPNFRRCHE